MKSIGQQITDAGNKAAKIRYRSFRCRNPSATAHCWGETEALVGSDREVNSLCPECQDRHENWMRRRPRSQRGT